MKKVSIIITSYNHKKYLIEAVESVLRQTAYIHEIIIADDHSTDGSIDTIKKYISQYPNQIKAVFQEKNAGIPKNRNSALETVTGDYVFILDGDDRFLPGNVETMLQILEKFPSCKCVYGNLQIIDPEGKVLDVRDKHPQPQGNIFFQIARGYFGILRNMIIDYQLLKKIGFMDENLPRYDGFELTLRLAKEAPIAYSPEPLAQYRVHPTSDSKGLNALDHLNDLTNIYKKMQPLIADLTTRQREEIRELWRQRLLRFFIHHKIDHDFILYINNIETIPPNEQQDANNALHHLTRESIQQLSGQKRHLQAKLAKCRDSYSYKIGHVILFPFKFIKRLLKNRNRK